MSFGLFIQFIREICEESLQAGKKSIIITTLQFVDKFTDIKPLIVIYHSGIERHKEINKTITYFVIGKFQQITTKTLIKAFDCQIAA